VQNLLLLMWSRLPSLPALDALQLCTVSCVNACWCTTFNVAVVGRETLCLAVNVNCRDIKPENVVLEGGKWDGRVYLIDFGGVQGVANAGELLMQ
jgi:hypothetical protein